MGKECVFIGVVSEKDIIVINYIQEVGVVPAVLGLNCWHWKEDDTIDLLSRQEVSDSLD